MVFKGHSSQSLDSLSVLLLPLIHFVGGIFCLFFLFSSSDYIYVHNVVKDIPFSFEIHERSARRYQANSGSRLSYILFLSDD
jgi:hypothetical protein